MIVGVTAVCSVAESPPSPAQLASRSGRLIAFGQATVLNELVDPVRGGVWATVDLPLLEIVLTLIVREACRGDCAGREFLV